MGLLAQEHPRFGYRRVHALLRRDSAGAGSLNIKSVHRLWKETSCQVVPRKKRRTRAPKNQNSAPQQALYPGHV